MKKVDIELSQERKLITYMITSTRFLKEIVPIFRADFLKAGYSRLVAGWIVEYYEQFKEAPNKGITDIYRSKRAHILDKDEADNVSDFLKLLSRDWEAAKPNNIKYAISEAVKYLKIRSQELLVERLEDSLLEGDPLKGEQLVANYRRIEPPSGAGASFTKQPGDIISAFMEYDEPLLYFPGDLGKVVGKMGRGDFVAFLAPMKRGKTWWLWYTAETAMYARLKVVFFTLEMTRSQMLRRGWQSLMGQPLSGGYIAQPYFDADPAEEPVKWLIKNKRRKMVGLDVSKVKDKQKVLVSRFRGGDVRMIALPSRSASVEDLNTQLDILEYYEGYVPDVVVVDYADYLKSSQFTTDYRHALDDIWSGLRRMSLEKNILVVTASQAAKNTFKADISELDVAEDIRKLAHVTHMIALNQKGKEAERGIMRVAQLAVREGKRVFQQAIALSCLDIGRIYMDSRLINSVILSEEEEDGEEKPKKKPYKRGR